MAISSAITQASALAGHANANRGGAAGTTVASGGDAGALSGGGTVELGGSATGGSNESGASNGGSNQSGSANGGKNTGGSANGGGGSAGAPNGGAGVAGNAGASGSSGALHCPDGTAKRISQEVPLPGGGYYCIDQGEVRNRDYKQFLDTLPSASGQTRLAPST
ncbi:MAG TPA: hypothetical protein VHW01_16090 [Polyangiaceae bacterium]|jgi:hypothetical protein|nr:hypothetical protein [Polyangiaceae bacterium]